jgi:hypothetical protein
MGNAQLHFPHNSRLGYAAAFPAFRKLSKNPARALSPSISAAFLFLALACNLPARSAELRLNLPQLKQTISLGDTSRAALRYYFSRDTKAGELPDSLQKSLLHQLPESFSSTCASMVRQWGAANSSSTKFLSVHLLTRQGDRVWVTFRCGTATEDHSVLYDERLGLIHLDRLTMELLPLGPDTDEEVYHVRFLRRLDLKNADVFSFHLAKLQNPCCDGPESRSQERLAIFADTPRGAIQSLLALTARDDTSHCDDPEVDTETTNHSEIKFERDANDFETTVIIKFHETIVDTHWESGKGRPVTVSDHSGTLRFRWNPTSFKFEPIH